MTNDRLIFDTHAHYYDGVFDKDREEILNMLPNEGVYCIINAGADIPTSKKCIEISKKYSYCKVNAGIHPENVKLFTENSIKELEDLIPEKNVVGIGEIGLDYHYSNDNVEIQKDVFIKQIQLANKYNLPVVIHDREAHNDTLEIIKKYLPRGIVHCFSGDLNLANEIINLGMFLGIGGIITFKNAGQLIDIVKNIPLENIVVETDAPYLSPVPFRGKRCKSSYIEYVAKKISEIKNISYEEVLYTTKENSIKIFKIEEHL